MRCPHCSSQDDKVVDSRASEDGSAIRRRRECLTCGRRFTTYERLDEVPFTVVKRSGQRVPFDRAKIVDGIRAASKNRPVTEEQMEGLAADVEEAVRMDGNDVSSQQIGVAVLERLRAIDEVAYMRFASVYKDFQEITDFERELGILLQKREPAKHRSR